MRLDPKDAVGVAVGLGALSLVAIHNGPMGHPDGHSGGVADAGGSVTSPVGDLATAFVDFNVVPMDRDVVLTRQVVVVRGRFIESIGPVGEVEPPRTARIIQGDGTRFLAPGLTDSHVHLGGRYDSWLPLFIANGVTTVFNLEGRPSHLALKRRIQSDEEPGPTVYTAGPYVAAPEIRTPADARRAVSEQAGRGYDFVKVHGDLSEDTYRALTEAGRELGLPIIGHAPRNLPFTEVLENGQAALSHAEEILQTRLRTLDSSQLTAVAAEMRAAGTWLMPTLAYFRSVADQWGSPAAISSALAGDAASHLPAWLRDEWRASSTFAGVDAADRDRVRAMADFQDVLVLRLHQGGVPMLAGTDAPIPASEPGFSLHREIQALRQAGLSGYAALATATANPGRFIQSHVAAGTRFGTLQTGARADILMLDADPRLRAESLTRPLGVMVRGRWYERADLDRMLQEVAAGR